MNLNSAVIKLNPAIVYMVGDVAYDADGSVVEYDVAAAEKLVEDEKYKELRSLEYPPITDYLDGVVKGDQEQIQAYIDACLAVKAKYPKPEGN